MKKVYSYSIQLAAIITLIVGISSCQIGRFVVFNFANITDHKIFKERELTASTAPFQFEVTENAKHPKSHTNHENEKVDFDTFLDDNNTVAFLIIKNDTIQYEKYFDGYEQESIVASFSMAKSVTSILIGCAIDEGLIKSVDESITTYIPELKENGLEKVTIKHLLQMTSGIDFNESYFNPFGDAASFYYGRKLRKNISKMKPKIDPGQNFNYISGNTQLLGLVLERALKTKTITEYLQEKIWTPLEMEYDASWSIDRKENGLEKTFCCLNGRARDFAKIGRLYLNKGNWNGTQIVSESWVEESTKIDQTEGSADYYQYQWWIPTAKGDFMAQGILGQFIYINPSKNLVIVRLGKNEGKTSWWDLFPSLAEGY
jgi:CubicO group peptidase (beta-lactamase class C family)